MNMNLSAKSKMAAKGPQNGRRGRCLPLGFGHSKQLSLNKFFDLSTPSMRKGRVGGKKKTVENSGHYVIASSQLPECRPLERSMLAPK